MTDVIHPATFGTVRQPAGFVAAARRILDTSPQVALVLSTTAMLGLLFQVGHFYEHAAQFTIWLLGDYSQICGRDTPWMSSWVTEGVRVTGIYLFPQDGSARQMMLGMEFLHLVANFIFLTGIACLYHGVRSKWVRWAFIIEGLHLCEHLSLTLTAYYAGKPIGVSTLFGYAGDIGSREFAVGYRVIWHFVLNLVPMPFCMMALMDRWHPVQKDNDHAKVA